MQMGACATVNDLVSYGSGLKLTIARINGSEPLANNNQNLYLNLKERKKRLPIAAYESYFVCLYCYFVMHKG